jgi:hypothetical protein
MTYVYILESGDGLHFYTGATEDLRERIGKHNAGDVPHTAKFRPWRLKTYLAFPMPPRPGLSSVTSKLPQEERFPENGCNADFSGVFSSFGNGCSSSRQFTGRLPQLIFKIPSLLHAPPQLHS